MLLRRDPGGAAKVRREIAEDLRRHRLTPDSIDDVVLVASELVTNAVLHARDGLTGLDVAWDVIDDHSSSAVVVRVNDTSSTPPLRRQAGPQATGGRGLAIVAAIAEDWGVRPQSSGKQVWARVPVRRTL
ncbi:MAG TPA: ATP-binding protein [Jatrophihabitans sp.]|nr:ATP-binding protein [Jatrophihabitans sp.]